MEPPGLDCRNQYGLRITAVFNFLIATILPALNAAVVVALREQTSLPITLAENPLDCVALGTGKALEFESQLAHAIDYSHR